MRPGWQLNPPVHQGELKQAVLLNTPFTVSQWNEHELCAVYKSGVQVGSDVIGFDKAMQRAEMYADEDGYGQIRSR